MSGFDPVATDQSLTFCLRMIFPENRIPLFGIMRQVGIAGLRD
jgi:hypothetical protein